MSQMNYAKFGEIKGSCTVPGREDFVEIANVEHYVEIPVSSNDGSNITGNRRHHKLNLTANVDKATVEMIKRTVTGTRIEEVSVHFIDNLDGTEKDYYVMTLNQVVVAGVKVFNPDVHATSGAGMEHKDMATYELSYGKIKWTFVDGNIEMTDEWSGGART